MPLKHGYQIILVDDDGEHHLLGLYEFPIQLDEDTVICVDGLVLVVDNIDEDGCVKTSLW